MLLNHNEVQFPIAAKRIRNHTERQLWIEEEEDKNKASKSKSKSNGYLVVCCKYLKIALIEDR